MKLIQVVILAMCALALSHSPALSLNLREIPKTYPGWAGMDVPINIAQNSVVTAVQVFYAAEGRWPATWAEVHEYGLYQTELHAPDGRVIDPDDNSLDCLWDVVYHYDPAAGAPPEVWYLFSLDDPSRSMSTIEPLNATLDDMLSNYDAIVNQHAPNAGIPAASWLLNDPNARRLAATLWVANNIGTMYTIHTGGRGFKTLGEFLNSGWSNIDSQSANPLTGETLKFDGSPFNFIWQSSRQNLGVTNADGEVCYDFM